MNIAKGTPGGTNTLTGAGTWMRTVAAASASGDGEIVRVAAPVGSGWAEGVDVAGDTGVGDAASESGVFVASGGVAVAADAAGRDGVELAVGRAVGWGVPLGCSTNSVSAIDGPAAGNSGEHANSTMNSQANKTARVFASTRWLLAAMASLIRLNAGIDQGRMPMRNFCVPHSTQMGRVAARPFFIVTASMSLDGVLALHLTQ